MFSSTPLQVNGWCILYPTFPTICQNSVFQFAMALVTLFVLPVVCQPPSFQLTAIAVAVPPLLSPDMCLFCPGMLDQ